MAYILIECDEKLSAKNVKERYRKRFGIEASYRCAKKVRGSLDESECSLSVCATGNEFLVDQYVARMTNSMDEKSPSWEKTLATK